MNGRGEALSGPADANCPFVGLADKGPELNQPSTIELIERG